MAEERTQPEAAGDKYLEEVEKVLSQDETRLGDVWKHHRKGLNANSLILTPSSSAHCSMFTFSQGKRSVQSAWAAKRRNKRVRDGRRGNQACQSRTSQR